MGTPWKIINPWRTCYTCQHYEAATPGSAYVRCMRSGSPLVALATQPCAYWVREPGADDEFAEEVKQFLQSQHHDPAAVLAAGIAPKHNALEARGSDGSGPD